MSFDPTIRTLSAVIAYESMTCITSHPYAVDRHVVPASIDVMIVPFAMIAMLSFRA